MRNKNECLTVKRRSRLLTTPNIWCFANPATEDYHAIALRISDDAMTAFDQLPPKSMKKSITAQDLITGNLYKLTRHPCQLKGCYCAAQATQLNSQSAA